MRWDSRTYPTSAKCLKRSLAYCQVHTQRPIKLSMKNIFSFGSLALTLMIAFVPGIAQRHPRFKTVIKNNNHSVFDDVVNITQDGQGFIWFLKDISIERFDGYTIKVYKTNPDDSLLNLGQQFFSLASLLKDPDGVIWLVNNFHGWEAEHLLKYDVRKDGFIGYKPDLQGARMGPLAFDEKTLQVWIGTAGRGLFLFDPSSRKTANFVNHFPVDSDGSPNDITSVQDRDSVLLLATTS